MTIKKYLTTPEEVLALKDTNTKIYSEEYDGYYQFVKGTLCYFYSDGDMIVFSELGIGKGTFTKYILVEEPVKDADENDIGKLCKFWNDDPEDYVVGALYYIEKIVAYPYCIDCCDCWYKHCRRLSPSEVTEITGYKVEE